VCVLIDVTASPSSLRKLVADVPSVASTFSFDGACACVMRNASPVAQLSACSVITYSLPSGAIVPATIAFTFIR